MTIPAKTPEVFAYLKACAAELRTVTYGELGAATKMLPWGLGLQLGYLRDHVCRPRGLPWINALVVNQETRRPGDQFLPEGVAIGRDEARLWRGMVLHGFAYDWSTVDLEPES
jgi:hypothetical protein